MEINAVYENVPKINGELDLSDKIKVEVKTEIPTENIGKIINLNSTVNITETKVENGKIKYVGKTAYFLCYLDSEKKIKKYETGVEFKGEIKDDRITENSCVTLKTKKCKTEGDVSGVFLSVIAHLEINAKVYTIDLIRALSSGENLIVKSEEKGVVKRYKTKHGSFTAVEEKDLNYKVEEVLSHNASVGISAVQCGVGSIIIDGEVFVSSVFLQSDDKKGIIKENFSYPFRAEIEYEECMPTFKAKAEAFVKSVKTDISVDEQKNLSRLSVSVQLSLLGEVYSTDSVSLAIDVFDLKNDLKPEKETVFLTEPLNLRVSEKEYSGRVQVDLEKDTAFLLTFGEDVEIIEKKNTEKGVQITGIFTLTALFSTDGGIITRKIELPFEEELTAEEGEITGETFTVKNSTLKIINDSECEVSFYAYISYYTDIKKEFTVIKNVIVGEEKKEKDSAISVYIPYSNEDIWSLSKRLNVSPEMLSNMNPELQFPLSGNERIVVYRQK